MTMHKGPKPISPDIKAMEAPREPRRQPGRGASPKFATEPGTPPENPANVDHQHEPAGLERTDWRLQNLNQHRKKD